MIFPSHGETHRTRLVISVDADASRLPVVRWVGSCDCGAEDLSRVPGEPLLLEHSRNYFGRPGLRGHRLSESQPVCSADMAGRDWSTAFSATSVRSDDDSLTIEAVDDVAGLALRTEVESLPGGALRARHILTNIAAGAYVVDGLEVSVPIPDWCVELLDFSGRHKNERVPQRRPITDGVWLRESRGGRPGLGSATMLIAGAAGLGFANGAAIAISVASSGNSVLYAQRYSDGPTSLVDGDASSPRDVPPVGPATLGGGELLLPGEIVLAAGESYATPWVFIIAAENGLDGVAARLHTWQRSLPAHPAVQPVTLNTWEAVYFDHDPSVLLALVDKAAQVGIERFVLDDGWFRGRRNDRAGLGDWSVDDAVWPQGLTPLIDRVRAAGMEFGIWLEPEMVNPDSDLYRAHPDWVLAAGERLPLLQRNQLVLDLTNPEAWQHVYDRVDDLLSTNSIDHVKWDHNRNLLEAGSPQHGGAPAAHRQADAFTRLLDALRERHPHVAFESCASGGARIDLNVVERIQRVWTSDQTDALARQKIQSWTAQVVAPEYLGAHVSSPTSHHSGRTLSLDFRAGTAMFGAFGVEWDLTQASADELERLAKWVSAYKRWRPLLHSGRVVRLPVSDPAVLAHGVVAPDQRSALLAHVQIDESAHYRGVMLRVPGLIGSAAYRCRWVMPSDPVDIASAPRLDPAGPSAGALMTGTELARIGLWLPRQRPETIRLIAIEFQD
jgi:alpha-galactosidase